MGGGSGRDSSSDSYHHSGRHRSSSNSVDGDTGKASKAEKSITSPNRFEKLENLDPDIEDSVLEPSSSMEVLKGSSSKNTDTEKKRDRDRSGGGSGISSSTVNHRGRKGGNIIYHKGVKGHSSDPEMAGKVRNHEGTKTTGKTELLESGEVQSSKVKRDKSDFRRTSSNDSRSLDNESDLNDSRLTDTSLSTNCKNNTTSTSGIEAGQSHESLICPEEQLDLSQDAQDARRKMAERTSYSRVSP